jgi:putative spermidine/putrescine transport system ATP-binding protein/spermidine/putrescine transport system ATP-binding protein
MSDKIVVMKDGRKLQEGPPEAVYNAPENHFVADFLGHSNFLSGEVTGHKREWTVVTLKNGQEILSVAPRAFRAEEPAEIVIRAQKINIESRESHQPDASANFFFGRVKDRSYMGGEIRYVVETDNGIDLHVISMVKASTCQIGQEVALQAHAADCRLLNPKR